MRRNDWDDMAFLVEGHTVDAHFAVGAGFGAAVDVVLVDAVIDDVPFVLARQLEHRVVCGAVDKLVGLLEEDGGIGSVNHLDGSEGRLGRAVAYMIVGRTGIIDRPEEVVRSFAIEDVGAFAVGPGLERTALRSEHLDGFGLDAEHVGI